MAETGDGDPTAPHRHVHDHHGLRGRGRSVAGRTQQRVRAAATLNVWDAYATNCSTPEPFWVSPVSEPWSVTGQQSFPGPSISGEIGQADVKAPAAACTNTAGNPTAGGWISVNLDASAFSNSSTPGFPLPGPSAQKPSTVSPRAVRLRYSVYAAGRSLRCSSGSSSGARVAGQFLISLHFALEPLIAVMQNQDVDIIRTYGDDYWNREIIEDPAMTMALGFLRRSITKVSQGASVDSNEFDGLVREAAVLRPANP
jgi:hypothetical protein